MKKYFFVLSAFALLFAFAACTPENNNGENGGSQNNQDELTVTGEALEITDHSASLTGYANLSFELGDAEVGIMYDEGESFEHARKSVAKELDENNMFMVRAYGLTPGTTYYYKSYVQNGKAIKYGAVKTFTTSYTPVESISLDRTDYSFNMIGDNIILSATILPANASITFKEWSTSNADVAIVENDGKVIAKGNGKATIMVTTKDQSKTATCEVTVSQRVISIKLDQTSLDMVTGDVWAVVATVYPSYASNTNLDWTVDDNSVATLEEGLVTAFAKGKAKITVSATDGTGITATCDIVVSNPCPEGAVDLGMKSSDGYRLYWAKTNLSTSGLCANPEEYGDYYAWGETEPKDYYDWSTYKWCNGNYNSLTKYNTKSEFGTVDNKMVLDPEDDAAHVKLGGTWRMPIQDDLFNLVEKCTWTWTTENGVNGYKGVATNGNSIFFPAAGSRAKSELYNTGSDGDYWSASLYSFSRNDACRLMFYSDRVSYYGATCTHGFPIRPVTE